MPKFIYYLKDRDTQQIILGPDNRRYTMTKEQAENWVKTLGLTNVVIQSVQVCK